MQEYKNIHKVVQEYKSIHKVVQEYKNIHKVVQEYERAVIFRLGRLLPGGAKGPGRCPS